MMDFKLGLRLLLKYPGLTIIGCVAMAFAIAVGAGAFEVVKQLTNPSLRLDEGDRIVAIRTRDLATGHYANETMRDLVNWRESLTTLDQLSAFRTVERNLSVDDGVPEPVPVAEMSASGFRVARVEAVLGRTLVEADELPSAPPVIVISYDIWQQRFSADPHVVGREVRIGRTFAIVVGVMPEHFAFPVAHRLWLPLQTDGPVQIFGRLASDATISKAQAEMSTVNSRTEQQQLRPIVERYAVSFGIDMSSETRMALYSINVFFVMLLALICGNVALLMFARAVTREAEIIVRSALGASRGRIVMQLFAEALTLAGLASVIGLAAAYFALRAFYVVFETESGGRLPFWFQPAMSPATAFYTVVLTLIAASIAGALPALKMTSPKMDSRLRRLAAGGGLRFGRLWTAIVIAQVAATVALPAAAFFVRRSVVAAQTMNAGFAAEQYLSARIDMDLETPSRERFLREFATTIAAEPTVQSVTFTDRLPRTQHSPRKIEIEGDAIYRVANATVDLNYFDALNAPALAGHLFNSGDRDSGRTVIVNESFVRRALGGRNAIGHRIRYVDSAGDRQQWFEIIGVVKDLGTVVESADDPGIYQALREYPSSIYIAIHLRQNPAAFGPHLRQLARTVDAGLRLYDVLPMTEVGASMWLEFNFLFKLIAALSGIALVLSLAGIYAVTSFAVARRTREIGIRVALGADARGVLKAILARPLAQVGLGILAGGAMTGALSYGVMRDAVGLRAGAAIVAYAAVMMSVCLLACIVPIRRALRVQPTEALRYQ